jgi:heterodisulfide reductase subunit A-like polyferredoxin
VTAPIATNQTVIVVGGGISGMTAALEAAECGTQVVLVERNPSLGGRTAMPVTYYSQRMSVAYGGTAKEAGLDGHVIAPAQLTAIADRKVG